MTKEEMIAQVKKMAEVSDDEMVGYYLDNAKEILLNQLHPFDETWEDEVPPRYINLQMRMTVVLLNKRGADGESVHIENGIHRHYSAGDIPGEMLREVTPRAVIL